MLLSSTLILLWIVLLLPSRHADAIQVSHKVSTPLLSPAIATPTTSRRSFFAKATTAITSGSFVVGFCGKDLSIANAAIDVSGLPLENDPSPQSSSNTRPGGVNNGGGRGVPPSQLKSGPLANTKLGFQVGGGPRPEDVVRAIDEPRYEAARKAQGLGPLFLENMPIETQPEQFQLK